MTKVMLDVDGVLADYCAGFFKVARNLFVGKADALHFTTRTQPFWDNEGSLTKDEARAVRKYIANAPAYWYELTGLLTTHEWDCLAGLCCAPGLFEVYFVTNRYGVSPKVQTEKWLQAHLHIPITPTVIVAERKGEVARAIGADWAIEDKAGNAVHIDYHTDHRTKVALIDRLYNQYDGAVLGRQVVRVDSVMEFLSCVAPQWAELYIGVGARA